ncbi:MAG: DNA-processing protein DprA [Spongiibacteraceae bacterium]|jgi:DNA processing protein|nr:DNA-processing protein DprA [Spongiibacteraceae bacterium]
MSNPEHHYLWLVSLALPDLGRRGLLSLLQHCPDPRQFLQQPPATLPLPAAAAAALRAWQKRGRASDIGRVAARQQKALAALGGQLLCLGDEQYPDLLREIADPPPVLFALGNPALPLRPAIAIVGSRRASATALADARRFAGELGAAGFCVISGLALGVDGAAHQGALDADAATIAVLGTGLDVIYPRRHSALYKRIAERGLLLTEQPLGAPPRPGQFPARNRIISGLSLGTLVVEAAANSGSLITARLAAEQNREVFALPGSIHHPGSQGCNSLIRSGATLVQTVADIVEQLSGWSAPARAYGPGLNAPRVHPDPAQQRLLAQLGYEPTSLESLAERSGFAGEQLLAMLGELELEGWVECVQGAYQRVAIT